MVAKSIAKNLLFIRNPTGQTNWSNVPNSSLALPCNGLFTFSRLRFSLQTCYFTALLGISSRIMEYVMF